MRSAVIIQARCGSSRYPNKMLHQFSGKTALEWVLKRCNSISVDVKVLATSDHEDDAILADLAASHNWTVYRGSLHDVLARYAGAVRTTGADIVVRGTGDCVLVDPKLINYGLDLFAQYSPDYFCFNNIVDGFDFEIVASRALLEADENATLPSEREHVTPYIKKNPHYKKMIVPYPAEDFSAIHLSLDYPSDALAIHEIICQLGSDNFTYHDVLRLIQEKPWILDPVKHIVPNEGYRKSLREDEQKS